MVEEFTYHKYSEGKVVEMTLTKHQLERLLTGYQTKPVNEDAIHLAKAHVARIVMRDLPAENVMRNHTVDGNYVGVKRIKAPRTRFHGHCTFGTFATHVKRISCSCGGHLKHDNTGPQDPPCWENGSYTEADGPTLLHFIFDGQLVGLVDDLANVIIVSVEDLGVELDMVDF